MPFFPLYSLVTATLEQTQQNLAHWLEVARGGEEVVITQDGQPVGRLTGIPPRRTFSPEEMERWMQDLTAFSQTLGTGRTTKTVQQILDEDRGE